MKTSIITTLLATACVAFAQSTVFEYPDGLTIKMNPNATRAGFNFGSLAGNPSSPQNGDGWYNSTTGKVMLYQGGAAIALGEADLTNLNASNLTSGTIPAARFPAFTGDATSSAGATALTLATVNGNVGTFGSSTAIPVIIVDAKGRITGVSTAAVIAPAGTLTGTTLAANVTGSSLTSVGTITSGTWSASIGAGIKSTGTGGIADAGKLAVFDGSGALNAAGFISASGDLSIGRIFMNGGGGTMQLNGTFTGARAQTIPDANGTWALQEWVSSQGYGNANLNEVLQIANNLSDVADAATARTNLGLAIGTNVQAFDADLTALSFASATGEVTPNFFYAGPNGGGADNPSFRAIEDADIPEGITRDAEAAAAYQAADADLADLADGTLTGSKVGTGIDATNITAGTLADARFPATLPAASGANLTNLNASNLSTGTVAAARGGAGTINGILKANGSGTVSQATAGTDYVSPSSSQSLSATTFDANAGTNVLKFFDEFQFPTPHQVDGTGAVLDAVSTSPTYGHAIFSPTADKAANFVLYRIRVPADYDSGTDLQAQLTIRLNGADTAKQAFEISMAAVTSSASADSPTFTNPIAINFAGDASGASGDIEISSSTTLTSWRSSIAANQMLVIKLARDGDDATNDTSTVSCSDMNLTIRYYRIQ